MANETTSTQQQTTTEQPASAVDEDVIVVDSRDGSVVPDDQHPRPRPGRGGRPPVVIDLKMLHAVASTFASYDDMAIIFDCSSATLKTRFRAEVEKGRAMGRMTYRQEMRARAKRSDRVLIHMYEKHVEPPPARPINSPDGVIQIIGDAQRPLIVREIDEDSDNGNR